MQYFNNDRMYEYLEYQNHEAKFKTISKVKTLAKVIQGERALLKPSLLYPNQTYRTIARANTAPARTFQ